MEGSKGPAVPRLPLHSLDQSHLESPETRGSSQVRHWSAMCLPVCCAFWLVIFTLVC